MTQPRMIYSEQAVNDRAQYADVSAFDNQIIGVYVEAAGHGATLRITPNEAMLLMVRLGAAVDRATQDTQPPR